MTTKSVRTPPIPVPEECYGDFVPSADEIQKFLSRLYPNMRELVRRQGIKDTDSQNETINNFIAYFMNVAPNHGHVLRYKLYDPSRGLPYYKFVLNRLGFFARSWKQDDYEDSRRYAYGIIDSDTPRESIGPGKFINIDNFGADEIEEAVVGTQSISQMRDYYAALQGAYVEIERKGAKAGKPTFESIALDLFDALMEDVPNPELTRIMEAEGVSVLAAFAKSKHVTLGAVNGWRKKMQESVSDMLGYDPRQKKKAKGA